MKQRHIENWCTLDGANVEVRSRDGATYRGVVDAVTSNGEILWLWSPITGRRLFEKEESYQIWAVDDRIGFHYEAHRTEVVDPRNGPTTQK